MKGNIMTKLTEGGIVSSPLLLRACRAGAYGSRTVYPGGSVEQALFTYLCGVPDGAFFHDHPELFIDRYLVSMSPEWERFIGELPYKKRRIPVS